MEKRDFVGGAISTTLSNSILATDMFIDVADGDTFPVGVSKPFVISIGRGTVAEEKVLVTLRDENVLAVSQRGYDGTSASSHALGTRVDHVLDAIFLQSVSDEVNDIIDSGASRVDSAQSIIAVQVFS
jgi:hypothetical protein